MLKRRFLGFALSRRLVLAALFCFALLLFCLACRTQKPQSCSGKPVADVSYETLLQHHEKQNRQYITNLTKQISQLKKDLQETSRQLQMSAAIFPLDHEEKSGSHLEHFLQNQLRSAENRSGEGVPDEFDVLPFEMFTLRRVYQLETGLTRHPVERPVRPDRRNELDQALEASLHVLNDQQPGDSQHRRTYSPKDFFEGIFRTERDKGTTYDLTFRENIFPDFRRLVFFRPFAPVMKVWDELIDTSQMLINIIVPLAKQVEEFRRFMQNFSEVCIRQDGRTHLTVVIFGSEKVHEVKGILDQVSRTMKYRNFTLIHLHEEFSRGRGLEVGARAWSQRNILLFFCDVNVHFTAEFLNTCRLNTAAGKKVFYPVMFSQYNPEVIYGQHIPPIEERLVIRKDFGFWKDFDFGMTCQYASDFLNIGGFEVAVTGRATEDVALYRKYLHSKLEVVRAPSRGLFHVWHEILCPEHLPTETFKLCLSSKATNEASLGQMGNLLYHQQIKNHLQKYNNLSVKS